jgi:hypothetical protein
MPLPCNPANAVANQILQSCDAVFAANQGDCNQFLKTASAPFLPAGYFGALNADGIVALLQDPAKDWVNTRDIATAIARAQAGDLVVAAMNSAALGSDHGHLAIVVGCPGQASGGTIVPICYAGSLGNPAAQIAGARLSGTFPATMVRAQGIDYYIKTLG